MQSAEDTIVAISTPQGTGGIAVIRLSGAEAVLIADQVFDGKKKLAEADSHKAVVGKIVEHCAEDNTTVYLDEAVVTLFRAPQSYTREDVVEISCHGGNYLSHRILGLLIDKGARLAAPGEFTQRAFLNGRLDLSQAEAVADIIHAKTEASLRSANKQFHGALSEKVRQMRSALVDICSLVELELDFAEEDVEFVQTNEIENRINASLSKIGSFLETYQRGKILREGVLLVVAGKPNVGKSSLLNALLKEERAIVTEIPGTTRDTLEEQLDIQGVFFRIVDTAGLRQTRDRVEQIGVERTQKQLEQAEIVLLLFDGSEGLDDQDRILVRQVLELSKKNGKAQIVAAVNKIDIGNRIEANELRPVLGERKVVEISARHHTGIKELEKCLLETALGRDFSAGEDVLVTNLRQKQALETAMKRLEDAGSSLRKGLSGEFVALDIRGALDALGEIVGEVTTEDILGNIFAKFCIGK